MLRPPIDVDRVELAHEASRCSVSSAGRPVGHYANSSTPGALTVDVHVVPGRAIFENSSVAASARPARRAVRQRDDASMLPRSARLGRCTSTQRLSSISMSSRDAASSSVSETAVGA
jgi:hypothetical protein